MLVLSARAENHLRGQPNLADTISRLQTYQEADGNVLYAPGLQDSDEIRSLAFSVDRPVNVLILPGGPWVPQLFEAGTSRVSVGSAINLAAQAAVVEAPNELLDKGSHDFWSKAVAHIGTINQALSPDA